MLTLAKQELDATLRTAITSFTTSYASKILSPILATTQPTNQPEVPNVPAPNLIHPHWQPQVPQRVSSPLSFRSMSPNPMASPHLARSPTPLPQPPVLVFALSTELTGKSRDQIAKEIQGNMDKEFSGIRDILQEYAIGDWRTRETLVGAVQVGNPLTFRLRPFFNNLTQELVMDKQDIFLAQFPQDGTAETATATGLNISGI